MAGFILLAEGGGAVAQSGLADDLFRIDCDGFAGQSQSPRRISFSQQLISMLGTAERRGLTDLEAAAIDQHAVVDHPVWLEALEVAIGIHAAAGPLTAAQVAGADENVALNDWRDDLFPALPGGVERRHCVAVDAVDGGINLGLRKVGKPALLAGVPVLPLLDLNELLGPIDVGVAEQVMNVLRAAPGFVGVGNVVGKNGKR